MKYSVVVPAHNEEESLEPLYGAIKGVLDELNGGWELIVIDDGSTDDTYKVLKDLHNKDRRVKSIHFRRQFGQTAGWSAGFKHARGEYVIVLDADLQNDPRDIPAMLHKMNENNYDVISGWRKNRKDKTLLMIFSKLGNLLRRFITGEKIRDHGCSLKIYRREALEDLELYGEMHRYITALLTWKGFRIGEIPVRHYPRKYGNTKYGVRKKLKGILDLLIVKFWTQYSARPMHFFGSIGIIFALAGFGLGGTLIVLRFLEIISLADRATPLLAALLVILGVQFLLAGVLADIVTHTYYAKKDPYFIRETRGLGK